MSEGQLEGPGGLIVDRMIRRSVRKAFRGVWWLPPPKPLPKPCIVVANHHGWHDGYVMFQALTALDLPFLLWMEELGAFPLFGKAGAMPYPVGKPEQRAVTIRKTIRALKEGRRSLLLFPEGALHRPPQLMKFQRSLALVSAKAPGVPVIPVAIRYEMSMHERPECFVVFGEPLPTGPKICEESRLAVKRLMDLAVLKIGFEREAFQVLAEGTKDVNERFNFRRKGSVET